MNLSYRASEQYLNCEVIEIPQYEGYMSQNSFVFPKNSPYAELFDFHLEKFNEKGIITRILEKYPTIPPKCPDLGGAILGYKSVITTFVPLAFGIIFGIILFILEKILVKSKYFGLPKSQPEEEIIPDPKVIMWKQIQENFKIIENLEAEIKRTNDENWELLRFRKAQKL